MSEIINLRSSCELNEMDVKEVTMLPVCCGTSMQHQVELLN